MQKHIGMTQLSDVVAGIWAGPFHFGNVSSFYNLEMKICRYEMRQLTVWPIKSAFY